MQGGKFCEAAVHGFAITHGMMIRAALTLALLSAPQMAAAQAAPLPQLSLENRMLMRCSAAFSLVAFAQASGNEDGTRYRDMSVVGREFFVRSSARVMDAEQLDRTQIEAVLTAEAQALWDEGSLHDVMPACLTLLPAE